MATDGQPNCPASGNTQNDDTPGAVAAVTAARTAGFPTFVVGLSAPAGAANDALNMMADAGGYPRAGDPQYYPVTSAAEFIAVLQTLVGVATTCTFSIPPPPTNDGTTSREDIAVTATPAPIPHGCEQRLDVLGRLAHVHHAERSGVRGRRGRDDHERHDRLQLPPDLRSAPARGCQPARSSGYTAPSWRRVGCAQQNHGSVRWGVRRPPLRSMGADVGRFAVQPRGGRGQAMDARRRSRPGPRPRRSPPRPAPRHRPRGGPSARPGASSGS